MAEKTVKRRLQDCDTALTSDDGPIFDSLKTIFVQSVEELAEHHQIAPRYVRRLLQVAFLAPKIVEGIAAGTQPQDLTAEALAERMHLPLLWTEQEQTVFAS
jgi:hypothetical protein